MRNEKRNYVMVGAFVLAMLAALVVWIAKVSGGTGPSDDYYVVFENVSGLKSGVEILYEGYPVGLIEGIEPIEKDGQRRFRVDVSVQRGWSIPEDSRATIATGLFSAAVIDIQGGNSKVPLEPGSEIPSLEASDLMAAVNEAANGIRSVLDDVADAVPGVVQDVERLTKELNVAVDSVNTMLAPTNVERVSRIIANVETFTGDANQILADLGDTRRRVDGLIGRVDTLLDDENGDVARAMADLNLSLAAVARHIDAISSNLEVTTRNMGEFSKQIRDDPSLVLRGREAPDDGK